MKFIAKTYKITATGSITIDNHHLLSCPDCRATRGLTVSGRVDGPATVECPKGHAVPIVWPFNQVDLLLEVMAASRRPDSL